MNTYANNKEIIQKVKGRWVYDDSSIEWLKENSINYATVIDLCTDLGINKDIYYKIIKEQNLTLKYKEKYKDLNGRVFGRWKIIEYIGEEYDAFNHKRRYWLGECQCHKKTRKKLEHSILLAGMTNSCKSCVNKKYNDYDLSGEFGVGWTFDEYPFHFDLEDYDKIKDYCWHKHQDGYLRTHQGSIDGIDKMILMHVLILNVDTSGKKEVDHINRNPYDNRKSNLRIVTHQQNMSNISLYKTNKSGIQGVYKERGMWKATLKHNGKQMALGSFKNKNDAIKARLKAENKHLGEYSSNKHLFEKYSIN